MNLVELNYGSAALGTKNQARILLPSEAKKGPFHVLFLLHGLLDDHQTWTRYTNVELYADGLPLIIVMPSAGRSFYVDAIEGFPFQRAIGEELVDLIEGYFPTKLPWCTAGLSMGGYGAFRLALSYPERFVSAVSHSGALTHFSTAPSSELKRLWGENPSGTPYDLIELAKKLPKKLRPKLRFDCGVDDFLIEHNRIFHGKLDAVGYKHEYQEFPGVHNWVYWDEHVKEALAFHKRNLKL